MPQLPTIICCRCFLPLENIKPTSNKQSAVFSPYPGRSRHRVLSSDPYVPFFSQMSLPDASFLSYMATGLQEVLRRLLLVGWNNNITVENLWSGCSSTLCKINFIITYKQFWNLRVIVYRITVIKYHFCIHNVPVALNLQQLQVDILARGTYLYRVEWQE